MHVTRFATLPPGLRALTATARGMVDHTLTLAAQQAFGELMGALGPRGLIPQIASVISLCPDKPQGPHDPDCRYVAGAVFGHSLARQEGACAQPDVPLSGTLAWQDLAPGRYAVFTHTGPYTTLHQTWRAVYTEWLPHSGTPLRQGVPPLELCINTPDTTPPEQLHTEIWLPLAD